ncbi:uncharacterized protein LOC123720292 [Pieris brassicae]|uniref:uncharacterized protein LOC123720292 n=1 Tax=Pieris brassicae TaxID=7116 RepID=UPI001E65EA70|nr:uncharacterized protein LOC123720292 [Pieris brassicae]
MAYEFYNQDVLTVTVLFMSLIKYGEKLRIFSFYVYISLVTERVVILNKYLMYISDIGIVYWCTTEVFYLIILCLLCENVHKIRNRTEVLANDIIMNYNISDIVRKQAKTLKEVVGTWPMNIIVYGMFQLNVNFMLKFINISTTYFILLIQVSHFI